MAILAFRRELTYLISHTIFICVVFALPKNDTTDMEALLEFKFKITSDPLQVMESWNVSTPICQWYGVTCGKQHKRVKVLYLNSTNIVGAISPYIGNLSFLWGLFLHDNSFIGNIPPEIGRLQRLRLLVLSNNSLNGTIPSNISHCYNLEQVDLFSNHFEGEIPAELGALTKLIDLFLSRNNFHGNIPSSLGNLSTIERLEFSENKLTGIIPSELGRLNKLRRFGVLSNRISGTIPTSMYNLSSLSAFGLADNLIHGSLPPNLFNTLPNLEIFNIAENQLTGNIPISLYNATNLYWFETAVNKFTGKFSSLEKLQNLELFYVDHNHHGNRRIDDLEFLCSLTNNTNLKKLEISLNNLGGVLPICIGNLSSVLRLGMVGNSITGPIPTEIGNLINIEALGIGENQLLGEIPSSIGNLEKLAVLYLSDNKLSGNIPSSLGNLKWLTELSLNHNKLQGIIPHTLGQCNYLDYLQLHANDLVGSIPSEVFQISSLVVLDVSQNRLLGPLPELFGNLQQLKVLNVSENMLSQTIPSSLGKCLSLQQLYMQGNFFEGMIPPSLGSLRGIDVIDVSRNSIFGPIPRSLANLMLIENLNLSHNNLEGPVPEDGVFKNVSKFSIIANKKLCGGIPVLRLPKCNMEISTMKASHTTIKVVLGVSVGLLGILCFIYFLLSYWIRKKRSTTLQNFSSGPLLRLSYQSLVKATNNFASNNMLGSGNFGSVYKAILDKSETVVAVKVFNLQRCGASRSFLAECEVLKRIRHRNLVKILTACSSIDFYGNEFKALVYEFMTNGSLENWLHPVPTKEGTNLAKKHLGFLLRLNIAIDIACALDYLHNQYEIPIVHRDIKPSNVLLNNEMIGHVGDFGLSKILLDASSNSTTGQTSSTGFKGTIGYIPPEYGMGTSMSTQGDVYSYGVLLLELFTGKRPNDDIFHGNINLNCFVKAALPDEVAGIVDPALHAEMDGLFNARKPILEYLNAIFWIGVSCSANLPGERKSMKDVVVELKSIRNVFPQN